MTIRCSLQWMLLGSVLVMVGCQGKPAKKKESQPVTNAQPMAPEASSVVAPQPGSGETLLDHKYFVIVFDKHHRIPKYVEYTLTAEQLQSPTALSGRHYFADPMLANAIEAKVFPNDYDYIGYERSPLANADDFNYDQAANDETFVMSNMVPQTSNLNSGSWKHLEMTVRRWACGEQKVRVITGPIIKEGLPISQNGITIPNQFFKVVLDETPPQKMLAFIYNQNDKGNMLKKNEVNQSVFNSTILPQISATEKTNFAAYKIEPQSEWKSFDCMPQKKQQQKPKTRRRHV